MLEEENKVKEKKLKDVIKTKNDLSEEMNTNISQLQRRERELITKYERDQHEAQLLFSAKQGEIIKKLENDSRKAQGETEKQ